MNSCLGWGATWRRQCKKVGQQVCVGVGVAGYLLQSAAHSAARSPRANRPSTHKLEVSFANAEMPLPIFVGFYDLPFLCGLCMSMVYCTCFLEYELGIVGLCACTDAIVHCMSQAIWLATLHTIPYLTNLLCFVTLHVLDKGRKLFMHWALKSACVPGCGISTLHSCTCLLTAHS